MKATLKSGHVAEIAEDRQRLSVYYLEGGLAFEVSAPEHGDFYLFADHITAGQCPVVSFDPQYSINGWPDWFYRVNVSSQSIERLNPWR